MPAARQPIPASLVINHEPRRPEVDPTLNIAVEVDRTGSPRNRLVTIGDSVTHGFMSGAIFRTDLSWPAVVAFELGDFATFRRPVYEAPSGPGGLPLDFERALRSFEARFGPKLDWHEIVRAASWAALVVLETARGPGKRALTPLAAARALGAQGTEASGTDASGAGPGIETLVVLLGSNNALQAVTRLEVRWSGEGYADLSKKGAFSVWRPEHFAAEWGLLVKELRRIRARHVIVGTVPSVTIAPIARGVRGKVRLGSRYYPYYTRPWVRDEDFDPSSDPHLTEDEARAVDSAIDAYNKTIIDSVAAARGDGLDWYLFDLGGLLDRLATKRYLDDPAARPAWWTPYPLPPELANLDPVPNTRFFASGRDGRTDGGLFSLDGIHPTTIGYGLIAQEVIAIMNLAQVEFRLPSGERQAGPGGVDFGRVLASDTLINQPPTSLGGQMATLGWLDDRLDWVRALF